MENLNKEFYFWSYIAKITMDNGRLITTPIVLRPFWSTQQFCPIKSEFLSESESVLTQEKWNNIINNIKTKCNFLIQAFISPPLCLSRPNLILFSSISKCSFSFHATPWSRPHLYLILSSSLCLECLGCVSVPSSRVTPKFILQTLVKHFWEQNRKILIIKPGHKV